MSFAIRAFKALSDATRLRLVAVLSQFELSVNELVNLLEMGQSRVSRHLKILSEAKLLSSRRDGLWVFYQASREGEGKRFLDATTPFLISDKAMQADLDMARHIIEDRSRKTRQFFNTIADDWETLSRDILNNFDLAGAVCQAIPTPCASAVDLGCGTGLVLEAMRQKAHSVIGVDGSSRMLELSRRRFGDGASDVSLRIGELDHLPLRDAESDFACINMVLHHLSVPQEALREIFRVIVPGGYLLVTDFNQHTLESMRSDYGDLWLGFDAPTLFTFIEEAGFLIQKHELTPVNKGLAVHIVRAQKPATV